MPGFALARRCAAERTAETVGMVLMHHGIFSFGESARESYERMLELVTLAEDFLVRRDAFELPTADLSARAERGVIAQLRESISDAAGAPMIVESTRTPRTAAFLARSDHADLASQGPMTPDHVIRTKRVPQIGRDVATYAAKTSTTSSGTGRGRALRSPCSIPRHASCSTVSSAS